jgi:hypothetical protein
MYKHPELLGLIAPEIFKWMFLSFVVLVTSNTVIKAIISIWFRKDLCNDEKDNEED